jgi:hypothetical protein
MSPDLEAIRARLTNLREELLDEHFGLIAQDVDTLLVEVEKLRMALRREFFGLATPYETAGVLGIEWPPRR